jgi:hypothetical protein
MFISLIFPSLIFSAPSMPAQDESGKLLISTLATTYLLTVESSPGTGAVIYITPADNGGDGNGFTSITREYDSGTVVKMTAVPEYDGRTFSKWTVNGSDAKVAELTLTMDKDYSVVAVYGGTPPPPPPPANTFNLEVSSEPSHGIPITVSLTDNNNQKSGSTNFVRNYDEGVSVSLTAPVAYNGANFSKWVVDGVDDSSQTVTLTMDKNHTAKAFYVDPPASGPYTLTVHSAPGTGARIYVSPDDNNGDGDGETTFTRQYDDGTVVTMTAIPVYNGRTFIKWIVNGVDNFNPTLQLTMDSDHTVTSVYGQPAGPGTNSLTVGSTPVSGASITVSPGDNNNEGNGTTPFTRVYNNDVTVTLTAPAQYNGNNFLKWTVDGVDNANASIHLTMDTSHTATAVYETPPPPETHVLTVRSLPESGVGITVSPSDNNGDSNGTTTFTRTYNHGTQVSLTAPAQFNGHNFLKWIVDGVDNASQTISVTMESSHTVTAVYEETAPPGTFMLTVRSYPDNGAVVAVSPADNDGKGNGTTTFKRTYNDGTNVTLTAPEELNNRIFSKWIIDGNDSDQRTVTVTMNQNRVAEANYIDKPPVNTYILTVNSSNQSGAAIAVSPVDQNGDSNGTTTFFRTYAEDTVVTLTAALTHNDKTFEKWHVDGVFKSFNRTIEVTMDEAHKARAFYIGSSKPSLALNRDNINFGHVQGGAAPPSESLGVVITNGNADWTASSDAGWLSINPNSGNATTDTLVSLDPQGLAPGKYFATISVTAPDAEDSPQQLDIILNVYAPNAAQAPKGEFSTPVDGSDVYGSVPLTGWVVDDIGVQHVRIYRENGNKKNLVLIGEANFVEGARPDIEALYPEYPNCNMAGWGYMLLTNFLPQGGNGTFTLHAIATDVEGNEITLGTKTINCSNSTARKPFGAIDTPEQGGTVSGNQYINWGWCLTPNPAKIPEDGSTIRVYVDGVAIGNPVYNIFRQDIADAFPGYANSNGAVGYFYLDTTAYGDGVHTIQWVVTDNAGNSDGVGSRYFKIYNTGSASSASSAKAASGNGLPVGISNIGQLRRLPVDSSLPVLAKTGFDEQERAKVIGLDASDAYHVTISEFERLELELAPAGTAVNGYAIIANQIRPLPVGSTIKDGKFYWSIGHGFYGKYSLVFVITAKDGTMTKKDVTVTVGPKF